MSTAHWNDQKGWLVEGEHPIWFHRFNKSQRERLLDDDNWAGFEIASILLSIVTYGLVAMMVTVGLVVLLFA